MHPLLMDTVGTGSETPGVSVGAQSLQVHPLLLDTVGTGSETPGVSVGGTITADVHKPVKGGEVAGEMRGECAQLRTSSLVAGERRGIGQ